MLVIANCMRIYCLHTDHIKLDIQITNTLTKHNITLSCIIEVKLKADDAKKKTNKKELKKSLEETKKSSNGKVSSKSPQLLTLTVSPGRLGLTLVAVQEGGGVMITNIDPKCTFIDQVSVGDRIVTIDDKYVLSLEDAQRNKDKVRKFGIIKSGKPSTSIKAAPQQVAIAGPRERVTDTRKQTFPLLTLLNANATNRGSEHIREDLMTELLQFNKRNGVNTQCKMGAAQYQVLCVPLKRRQTSGKQGKEFDNQAFHAYNKQTKVFSKFIDAWAKYCNGTDEDAADMILHWMCKQYPQSYVKNFDIAAKKNEKINGPALPKDFVSYDGTKDIKWNSRYGELLKYHAENGDCKVYTKSDLGKWVSYQRSAKKQNVKYLKKRIELLDNLDFAWNGLPEGHKQAIPGGDPIQNRAIAAYIAMPGLTIREALLLAGATEEELQKVKDPKHTWRTGYVYYKDQIIKKIENYDNGRKTAARKNQENLVDVLKGQDDDRFEKVFGETSHLLPTFLANAEERRKNGNMEEPRKRKKKRTVHEADEEDEQRKMPRVEDAASVPYPPQLDAAQLPEQQAAQNLYLQRVAQIHGGL